MHVNFALRVILSNFDHLRYGVASMSKTQHYDGSLVWRKSSYSIANGQCLEAAVVSGTVSVRDTVGPVAAQLEFPASAWREFTVRLRDA
jgi:hypothetical protein